ncbi:MAG: hypothetical protein RI995_712 [Bacteroidota bacterium]
MQKKSSAFAEDFVPGAGIEPARAFRLTGF